MAWHRDQLTLAQLMLLLALPVVVCSLVTEVSRLPFLKLAMRSLNFSPDLNLLALADDDGVSILDLTSGMRRVLCDDGPSRLAIISPDGHKIASSGYDAIVRLWDDSSDFQTPVIMQHGDTVNCLAFNPDSQTLASGGKDKTVVVWDSASGEVRSMLQPHAGPVSCIVFSPNGEMLASACTDSQTRSHRILIWRWSAQEVTQHLLGTEHAYVRAMAFSPDGLTLVTALSTGLVRFWDIATGRQQKDLSVNVQQIGLSPDGTILVTSGFGETTLWDSTTLTRKFELQDTTSRLSAYRFAGNGRTLITCTEQGTVAIWDTDSGTQHKIVRGIGRQQSPIPWWTVAVFGMWLILWVGLHCRVLGSVAKGRVFGMCRAQEWCLLSFVALYVIANEVFVAIFTMNRAEAHNPIATLWLLSILSVMALVWITVKWVYVRWRDANRIMMLLSVGIVALVMIANVRLLVKVIAAA